MAKELCECGKIATWIYMPGFQSKASPFFCDDCVHRGCSCNYRHVHFDEIEHHEQIPPDLPTEKDIPFKWIEEGKVWVTLDDKNREWPCCEYDYEEKGFDTE